MLAGGLANWVSERRKLSDEVRSSNCQGSMMAAYSAVFLPHRWEVLIPLEMPHMQSLDYYGTLIIAGATAVIGFVIFYLAAATSSLGCCGCWICRNMNC